MPQCGNGDGEAEVEEGHVAWRGSRHRARDVQFAHETHNQQSGTPNLKPICEKDKDGNRMFISISEAEKKENNRVCDKRTYERKRLPLHALQRKIQRLL